MCKLHEVFVKLFTESSNLACNLHFYSKLKFKKGKYESELTVSVTCLEEGICRLRFECLLYLLKPFSLQEWVIKPQPNTQSGR